LFRRRHFFQGRPIKGAGIKDLLWIAPDGAEMDDAAWSLEHARALGMVLNGGGIQETDTRGRPIRDDSFLLLLNAGRDSIDFVLPAPPGGGSWRLFLDTASRYPFRQDDPWRARDAYPLQSHSLAVLTEPSGDSEHGR
jgi:glycogen operon protein